MFLKKLFAIFSKKKEIGVFEAGDETLVCKGCGKDFIFTSSEKEFFTSKGFENKPVRCIDCRRSSRQRRQRRNRPPGRGR